MNNNFNYDKKKEPNTRLPPYEEELDELIHKQTPEELGVVIPEKNDYWSER